MSAEAGPSYSVPGQMAKYLAIVIADCDRKGDREVAALLRSAQWRVDAADESDGWNGGPQGHALHLFVPPDIYLGTDLDQLDDLEKAIKQRVNKAVRTRNEYISDVTLEMSEGPSRPGQRSSQPRDDFKDLWGRSDYFRLFISHKVDDKVLAADLKEACLRLAVSCFVAHEDIEPTAEWQSEIERALRSMDAILAVLTPAFHESMWTDQEVGVALGLGVPVVPAKYGRDPYGLMGKYQAIPCTGRTAAQVAHTVAMTLLTRTVGPPQFRMKEALVSRFEGAEGFDHAEMLMGLLRQLDSLPIALIDRLEATPKSNRYVRKCYDVQEHLPGLIRQLRDRATGE